MFFYIFQEKKDYPSILTKTFRVSHRVHPHLWVSAKDITSFVSHPRPPRQAPHLTFPLQRSSGRIAREQLLQAWLYAL
jgi:hypothetical protein